jgi:adenylate cyclase, class 2
MTGESANRNGRACGGDRFNAEVKARCARPDEVRAAILGHGGVLRGIDRQTDTYFGVPKGRLKVREGAIENALIAYDRPLEAGVRGCSLVLAILTPGEAAGMRSVLEAALPVAARVVKTREIYFAGNVKLHLDSVEGLGSFVEIEAQCGAAPPDRPALQAQAEEWSVILGIAPADTIAASYAEMLGAPR